MQKILLKSSRHHMLNCGLIAIFSLPKIKYWRRELF